MPIRRTLKNVVKNYSDAQIKVFAGGQWLVFMKFLHVEHFCISLSPYVALTVPSLLWHSW